MAPSFKHIGKIQTLGGIVGQAAAAVSKVSAEVARALPSSKNGETPDSLQKSRLELKTLFTTTIGASQLFYSADQWVRVQVLLETTGPVAIGTDADIVPVLSGKGQTIPTLIPREFFCPKGTRLYYAAEAVNRMSLTIEPVPWLEQISDEIRRVSGNVIIQIGRVVAALSGQTDQVGAMPAAQPSLARNPIQRLQRLPMPGRVPRR